MFFILSSFLLFGCETAASKEMGSIDSGHDPTSADIQVILAWDNQNDDYWPVGAGAQLWLEPSYLSFGGLQLLPCVESNTDLLNEMSTELKISFAEPLHELEDRAVGSFQVSTGLFCEVYLWYNHPQTPQEGWPQALGNDNVLSIRGQWGATYEDAVVIEAHGVEERGQRVRFSKELELDDGDNVVLKLYRDRQYMFDDSILSEADGTLILEAIVRETQVILED